MEEGVTSGPAQQALVEALQSAHKAAVSMEPSAQAARPSQIDTLRELLAKVAELTPAGLDATVEAERDDLGDALARVHARCAAVAIAAGDVDTAQRWLETALTFAHDKDLRGELEAARAEPSAYRQLVHGRSLFASGQERAARKLWKELHASGPRPLAALANEELRAPRPLRDNESPTLWRLNGCGLGFYGSRDRWPDGSYATTHCVSLVFIPVLPLRAYRVVDRNGGYIMLAREQLSSFARIARMAVIAATVLLVGGAAISSYLNDPARLARKHVDQVLARAAAAKPERALEELDPLLQGDELGAAGEAYAQKVGAQVIQQMARLVARPFTAAALDQAGRLALRYQALPSSARGGAAHQAALDTLSAWMQDLGTGADTAETRLALARHGAELADLYARADWQERAQAARLEVAAAKQADWPLDALAILMEEKDPAALGRADELVAKLIESPALLLDAGADLDSWVASSQSALRDRAKTQRELARQARTAAGLDEKKEAALDSAEEARPTAAALTKALQQHPWDQYAALALAREEAGAGKLEAAEARLAQLGKPGWVIRDARLALGQLQSALGKLPEAEASLAGALGQRLPRYLAASARLSAELERAERRVKTRLETGDVPADLQQKYEALTDDAQRQELVSTWARGAILDDPQVTAAREAVLAVSDVVELSLTLGSVQLRRAQGLPEGPERDGLLRTAERTFLAIRTAAEGQPEFRLGLGEIYARLGKHDESDAELGGLLRERDASMNLRVASVYRNLGKIERAKQVASDTFAMAEASAEQKSNAAITLGIMASGDEEVSESWLRKADQRNEFVRTSLLELEARKAWRQGKREECAAKFAQAAAQHLASKDTRSAVAFNNSAVAQQARFACNGDLSALAAAEVALERAYRLEGDQAVLTGNLVDLLQTTGRLRVLGKRINLRAFPPRSDDANELIANLLLGPERAALLADLAASPALRRSEQLLSSLEVLAASQPAPYTLRLQLALERQDEAGASQALQSARRVKTLDTSEQRAGRERWLSGVGDDAFFEGRAEALSRLTAVAENSKLDARTRAAASYLLGTNLPNYGVYKGDAAAVQRGCEALGQAARLWPALTVHDDLSACLVDLAATTHDAKAWAKARRELGPITLLAQLDRAGSPIAAAVKSSKYWGEVLAQSRADTSLPTLSDLRLARVAHDAELEARARPVLDHRLTRLAVELDALLDPTDPGPKDDLAELDRR